MAGLIVQIYIFFLACLFFALLFGLAVWVRDSRRLDEKFVSLAVWAFLAGALFWGLKEREINLLIVVFFVAGPSLVGFFLSDIWRFFFGKELP